MSEPSRRPRYRAALGVAAAAAVALVPAVATSTPASAALPHGLGGVVPTARLSAAAGTSALAAAAQRTGGQVMAAAALPDSVDLTSFAVPPGDQGQHGACASFTTAYTLAGWEANFNDHAGVPFQPMYVYNQVNGGSDTRGTTFGANFNVLENQGVAEAAFWTHPFSDYRTQPTTAERANAALHKTTAHTTLFMGQNQGSAGQTAIMTALANNQPVALGIPVYSKFFYLNSTDSVMRAADATNFAGNHAVAALGYDATGVTIENSWGAGWGKGGFATLSWDFVNQYVFEANASGTYSQGNALAPQVTALSSATVPTTGGLSLTITAARIPSMDTSSSSAVQFVQVANPAVAVDAPVTSHTDTTISLSVPQLPSDGQYRVVLTGSEGSSAPNGTVDVVTAVSPYGIALAPGSVARSDAPTPITVLGSGFGTTSAAFTANKVTATIGGKPAQVSRVDDTHLKVTAPVQPAGTTLPLVVLRNGVASAPVDLGYLAPAPVVTGLSPTRVSTTSDTPVSATVRNVATTGDATSVTLVSTSDPSVQVTAPITARSGTGVTFTVPARAAGGDFHVQITGSGGASATSPLDVLGYRTPFTGATTATAASAAGGTDVTVTGSGYGTTKAAFTANKVTATVAGKTANVRWVSNTQLVVTLPPGTPGATAPIVLLHDLLPGAPVTGVTYVAVISNNTMPNGSTAGFTTKLTGAGFASSTGWALTDGAGTIVASLPVVTSSAALGAAPSGVYVASASSATVKLPATAAGVYRLTFTPSSGQLGFTSKAAVTFSDLG